MQTPSERLDRYATFARDYRDKRAVPIDDIDWDAPNEERIHEQGLEKTDESSD